MEVLGHIAHLHQLCQVQWRHCRAESLDVFILHEGTRHDIGYESREVCIDPSWPIEQVDRVVINGRFESGVE